MLRPVKSDMMQEFEVGLLADALCRLCGKAECPISLCVLLGFMAIGRVFGVVRRAQAM